MSALDLNCQIVDVLESRLAELAQLEPTAIAERLLANGCRGKRHHCGRCPFAVYLQGVTGRPVQVMASYVLVAMPSGGWHTSPIPESVAAFVAYFDGGQFRELRA